MLLNVRTGDLDRWIAGHRTPHPLSSFGIWCLHSLILHPERVSSLAHILTWGRYAKPGEARRATPAVWATPKKKLSITRKAKRKNRRKKREDKYLGDKNGN